MKFENSIICDEVRVEDSGKHIIIGVYSETIVVPKFPARLSLSLWMQFYGDRNGDMVVELRILANKKEMTHGKGKLIIKDYKSIVTTAFNGIPIMVMDEGMLTFQIREENGRWKTFKKMPIQKAT